MRSAIVVLFLTGCLSPVTSVLSPPDADGDGTADDADPDDDNDGYEDARDFSPLRNIRVTLSLKTILLLDAIDADGAQDAGEIFFEIRDGSGRILTTIPPGGRYDVPIGTEYAIGTSYTIDPPENVETYTIALTATDADAFENDLVDLDGSDSTRDLEWELRIATGAFTRGDVSGVVNGSDDGSQSTDDDDGRLTFSISIP